MADITRGVRAFTIGTAVSRVFGLLRQSAFAFLYGVERSTDAYLAAFRVTDLLRDLFAESTLSAAIVPVLTDQKQKSKADENRLANNLLNILIVFVGIIIVGCILLAPYLARIVAFGFSSLPGKIELTSQLTALLFPFLFFIALAAWAMSYLNTENEFLVPSLAPAAFNVFSIVVAVAAYKLLSDRGLNPIFGMAIGVLAGGLMQFAVQVPMLMKKKFRYRFLFDLGDPEFRKVFKLFLPVAIGLAGSRVNVAVGAAIVSFLQEGSMTWLDNAFRIMHLPMGLFGIAVGTVALPTLSGYVASNNIPELRRTLFDSLKLTFFLTISSSVLIAFLAYPITRIIYEHGRFTPVDTSMTMQALVLYMIGVPFAAVLRNLAAVYYAFRDSKTPMYASFVSIGVNIGLSLLLMPLLEFRGIALAASLAAGVNMVILFYLIKNKIGRFDVPLLVSFALRLIVASGIGGIAGLAVNRFLAQFVPDSLAARITLLSIAGVAGLAAFYVGCKILAIREAREFLQRLSRR